MLRAEAVTARKDDAPAVVQATNVNIAGLDGRDLVAVD
jgi:hypothetical protein